PLKAQGTGTYDNLEGFRKAITNNDEGLTSGMLYAYAAIEENCPFVDFTPNVTLETGALLELADVKNVPLAGRDGNTGQTLMKTVLGQMLKIRNLKLDGWYSTNILGNNDGKVLARNEHSEIKMRDKLGVLEPLLGYGDFDHKVNIEYFAPRGDNKEAWDSIDFLGWLDQSISVKINWLGRDSILAAPLILDLIRLVEYAQRKGEKGIQSHLAMYFKNPLGTKARGFYDQYKVFVDYYKSTAKAECQSQDADQANIFSAHAVI
nr:inositol-3-phosphate synthase [Candidatus Brocadiales bacterium]